MEDNVWYDLWRFENINNPDFDKENGLLDGRPVYAETGEEGVICHVFNIIGTETKFCVDIGATDGQHRSNTKWLIDGGWNGLLLDKRFWNKLDPYNTRDVKQEIVTVENVNDILEKYNTLLNIDFLSIDIDYNDYWVLKSILDKNKYMPKLICFEFNPVFTAHEAKAVPYVPNSAPSKDHTIFYGASLLAFSKLGEQYGYKLIHTIKTPIDGCVAGRNGFLLLKKYLPEDFFVSIEQLHPQPWQENFKLNYRRRILIRKDERRKRHGKSVFPRLHNLGDFIDV